MYTPPQQVGVLLVVYTTTAGCFVGCLHHHSRLVFCWFWCTPPQQAAVLLVLVYTTTAGCCFVGGCVHHHNRLVFCWWFCTPPQQACVLFAVHHTASKLQTVFSLLTNLGGGNFPRATTFFPVFISVFTRYSLAACRCRRVDVLSEDGSDNSPTTDSSHVTVCTLATPGGYWDYHPATIIQPSITWYIHHIHVHTAMYHGLSCHLMSQFLRLFGGFKSQVPSDDSGPVPNGRYQKHSLRF